MNDPIDHPALDEYLSRGSAVSQRYREIGAAEVPAELDRRVLEEARAAVEPRASTRSRRWARWSAPLALAASAVLVLSIVIETGVQDDVTQSSAPLVRQEAAPPASPPAPAQEAPSASSYEAPSQLAAPPEAEIERRRAEEKDAAAALARRASSRAARKQHQPDAEQLSTATPQAVTQAPPATQPTENASARAIALDANTSASTGASTPPQEQPDAMAEAVVTGTRTTSVRREQGAGSVEEVAVTGARRARTPSATAGPRGTIPAARAQANLESADEPARSDPERWLEEIRELRRQGKSEQADREWQRFRAAFPDHFVPEMDVARQR